MNYGVKFALVPEKEVSFQNSKNNILTPKSVVDHFLFQDKEFSFDLNQKQLEDQLLRRVDIPLDTRMKLYDQLVQKRIFKTNENSNSKVTEVENNVSKKIEPNVTIENETTLNEENVKEEILLILSSYKLKKNINKETVVDWITNSSSTGRAPNGYKLVLNILHREKFPKEKIQNNRAVNYIKTLNQSKNELFKWKNF